MFLKLFFFVSAVAIATPPAAPSLDIQARYLAETTYLNTIDAAVIVEYPFYEQLLVSGGGRVSLSRSDFEGVEYKAEAQTQLLGFLKPGVRFQQHYLFSDTLSLGHFLFYLRFEARSIAGVTLYLVPAWFKRFTHLNKVVFLPLMRSSYTEHDFAGDLGVAVEAGDWKTDLHVATFEELSVFNLNNPFAEMRVSHPIYGMQGSVFFRYQVLLGFGRLNRFVSGISFTTTFN